MRTFAAALLAASFVCCSPTAPGKATPGTLQLTASLDDGTLTGAKFTVTLSYDPALVASKGQSFVQLQSFDFTLLGARFSRSYINQGGQVVFLDGVFQNVTASFQGVMPPNAPVLNITFGFGGPGVIGYIDHAGQAGRGTFALHGSS
jgi:hypothetical protein